MIWPWTMILMSDKNVIGPKNSAIRHDEITIVDQVDRLQADFGLHPSLLKVEANFHISQDATIHHSMVAALAQSLTVKGHNLNVCWLYIAKS